jgi:hypothetical protein
MREDVARRVAARATSQLFKIKTFDFGYGELSFCVLSLG